jgi:hypothetical protein
MYSTDLGRFLLIVLIIKRGVVVSSGGWEGSERPRSVSNSLKKCPTGNVSSDCNS